MIEVRINVPAGYEAYAQDLVDSLDEKKPDEQKLRSVENWEKSVIRAFLHGDGGRVPGVRASIRRYLDKGTIFDLQGNEVPVSLTWEPPLGWIKFVQVEEPKTTTATTKTTTRTIKFTEKQVEWLKEAIILSHRRVAHLKSFNPALQFPEFPGNIADLVASIVLEAYTSQRGSLEEEEWKEEEAKITKQGGGGEEEVKAERRPPS